MEEADEATEGEEDDNPQHRLLFGGGERKDGTAQVSCARVDVSDKDSERGKHRDL